MVCRFQCAARLAACSLQRASDAAIEEKAAIFVHGRDPQGWASATRPIMGALPLSAVSQHLRAGRRGVAARYHPTRCPAPSAQRPAVLELELRTGRARFPNVTLSLLILHTSAKTKTTVHRVMVPIRLGMGMRRGGGCARRWCFVRNRNMTSHISPEPPGAHLGPCSDCFLIPLILN